MNRLLISLIMSASLTSFGQLAWKNLSDISKIWIKVDSTGYLVYKPCNGSTPVITIDSGCVTIHWQLDGPSKLVINKFTRMTDNKSFYINAAEEGGNIEFTAEIKNAKQQLVLWTFGNNKWVMIPFEQKEKFRQVDNPCPTEMKHEKQFLPVEF